MKPQQRKGLLGEIDNSCLASGTSIDCSRCLSLAYWYLVFRYSAIPLFRYSAIRVFGYSVAFFPVLVSTAVDR